MVSIARSVLSSAELLVRAELDGAAEPTSGDVFFCLDAGASGMDTDAAYAPSEELWQLHVDVHSAMFDAAVRELGARSGECVLVSTCV